MAKKEGGVNSGKQVAFLWARTLRGDAAVKLLNKFGLLEQCIDYACESMQVSLVGSNISALLLQLCGWICVWEHIFQSEL